MYRKIVLILGTELQWLRFFIILFHLCRPDIEPLEIIEPDEDEMDEEDVLEDDFNMYDDDGDNDELEN